MKVEGLYVSDWSLCSMRSVVMSQWRECNCCDRI